MKAEGAPSALPESRAEIASESVMPRVAVLSSIFVCAALTAFFVLRPTGAEERPASTIPPRSSPTVATATTMSRFDPPPRVAASALAAKSAQDEDCVAVLQALEASGNQWTSNEVSRLSACIWAAKSPVTAELLLLRALPVDPANTALVDDLTQIYRQQGRLGDAVALLEQVIRTHERAEHHQALAMIKWYLATSERRSDEDFRRLVTEAADSWVRAAELDPSRAPEAYEMAADAYVRSQDFGRGAQVFERSIQASLHHPEDAQPKPLVIAFLYLRLSDLLIRAGQAGTALAYSDQALQLPLNEHERAQVEARRAQLQSMGSG